ncbi:TIR domain-containing protein [Pseudomonas shahriarae]|uniref:TIR domain-containing protein n=1 Tax=Pseudomonas shahriarae TaxID=2745512 RepID=UPI002076AB14|nr:TIR domain-containing protein [Pseudomonas shahriarae]MCM8562255.1 TIR domain-containing protein [Pseudomonas shahriarae]
MAKRKVFYSFHFDNDVMRVQQIRNMGVIEGNTEVTVNEWEKVKNAGDAAIKKWINDNMSGKSCVVVLIGKDTSKRPWVQYEIKKAWEDGKAILGVNIHNLSCPNNGKSTQGVNPFDQTIFKIGDKVVKPLVFNPKSSDAYNDIDENLADWIEEAIEQR